MENFPTWPWIFGPDVGKYDMEQMGYVETVNNVKGSKASKGVVTLCFTQANISLCPCGYSHVMSAIRKSCKEKLVQSSDNLSSWGDTSNSNNGGYTFKEHLQNHMAAAGSTLPKTNLALENRPSHKGYWGILVFKASIFSCYGYMLLSGRVTPKKFQKPTLDCNWIRQHKHFFHDTCFLSCGGCSKALFFYRMFQRWGR